MRRIFTFFFISLFSFLHAQVNDKFTAASNGLKGNAKLIREFSIPKTEAGHNVLQLEVPFSSAAFISPLLANAAKGKLIEKVQLIYTTFRESETFDQQKLNQQRLRNLLTILPDAFSNAMTEWELIGQTGAGSPEEGRNYFHGFIITWRPASSTTLLKEEMSRLDSLFMPKKTGGRKLDPLDTKKDPVTDKKMRIITNPDGSTTIINRDISEDSLWMYMKPSGEGYSVVYAKWADTAHKTVIVTETTQSGYKRKRTWILEDHFSETPTSGMTDIDLHNPDSVVTTVLRRNPWPHMVIVADVTGSMSPYTAQVLHWVPTGLASGRCSGFVFFNDGDMKSTNQKNIGKTGGIYSIQSQNFDSIFRSLKKTMSSGDGGDLPENPVEAAIYSLNKFNENAEIILIADNFSSPRDLELYEKLTRPVHIVLCGARGTVNPDYLFLARQTNGSVHTVHDDITTLGQMKDGETIVIEGKTYLLKNEHFICLSTFSTAQ
jgi:frataxin-like iron-binding protein CyaY